MFLTNPMKAKLIQYNRDETGVYDDEYKTYEDIKLCPYNQDVRVAFGTYTVPEAKGYYIIKKPKDSITIKEGDQIIFNNNTYTILELRDNWIWNKIVSYTVAVK